LRGDDAQKIAKTAENSEAIIVLTEVFQNSQLARFFYRLSAALIGTYCSSPAHRTLRIRDQESAR